MEQIFVKRDDEPDIKFSGELLGYAASSDNNAHPNYSGRIARWTELALYRTKGGRYVCEQIDYTRWQGEHTRYSGAVYDSTAEVIEFFGCGWLAKKLFERADIDASVEVE
jgi:hypothetical protein